MASQSKHVFVYSVSARAGYRRDLLAVHYAQAPCHACQFTICGYPAYLRAQRVSQCRLAYACERAHGHVTSTKCVCQALSAKLCGTRCLLSVILCGPRYLLSVMLCGPRFPPSAEQCVRRYLMCARYLTFAMLCGHRYLTSAMLCGRR